MYCKYIIKLVFLVTLKGQYQLKHSAQCKHFTTLDSTKQGEFPTGKMLKMLIYFFSDIQFLDTHQTWKFQHQPHHVDEGLNMDTMRRRVWRHMAGEQVVLLGAWCPANWSKIFDMAHSTQFHGWQSLKSAEYLARKEKSREGPGLWFANALAGVNF